MTTEQRKRSSRKCWTTCRMLLLFHKLSNHCSGDRQQSKTQSWRAKTSLAKLQINSHSNATTCSSFSTKSSSPNPPPRHLQPPRLHRRLHQDHLQVDQAHDQRGYHPSQHQRRRWRNVCGGRHCAWPKELCPPTQVQCTSWFPRKKRTTIWRWERG